MTLEILAMLFRQKRRMSNRRMRSSNQMLSTQHLSRTEPLEQRCLLTSLSLEHSELDTWIVVLNDGASEYDARNERLLSRIQDAAGREVEVLHAYERALLGVAVRLTAEEASVVQQMDEVAFVERSAPLQPQSLFGREWIRSSEIWQGTATAGAPGTQGEGIIVGILDSGIDPRNPSFAAIGPVDGYTHINPLGDGNYLGVCDPTDATFDAEVICNSKVIGIHNFSSDSVDDPDQADHGTHVAGIAAGNIVDVPLDGLVDPVRIAGVAPHANIISYDVCADHGASAECFTTETIAGIDRAIADGVDVLNVSLVNFPGDILQTLTIAFRNAQDAGIYVVAGAANDGPDASTVGIPGSSPWLTAVGSTTHNGLIAKTIDVVSPEPVDPELMGVLFVEGDSVPVASDIGPVGIRDAATIDPDNSEGCSPFAAGSFQDVVAFIDRGTCFYNEKIANAENAGAVAVVVANHSPGVPHTNAFLEQGMLPTAVITDVDGIRLRNWMAANSNVEIVLNSTAKAVSDSSLADQVSDFSSRGPNPYVDVLTPAIAAPGAQVLAAMASGTTDPEWGFFSGTSMASPHVAGAAALVRSLHPTWTPAEIQSALMLTAVPFHQLVKEDGVTAADPHDVGSGRIDLSQAALSGIVLHETADEFSTLTTRETSRELNLPAFVHSELTTSPSWTRTIRSAVDHTVEWTPVFSGPAELSVTVDPANIVLAPGAVQEITVTANFTTPPTDPSQWIYGSLELLPDDAAVPNSHFPVAVQWLANSIGISISENSTAEGAGVLTGRVFRTSDTTNAITVNLTSSDELQATVVSSVVIPAGQTESAEFDIQIVDDNVQELAADITLTAAATGHTAGTAVLEITDDDNIDLIATAFHVVSDHVRDGLADVEFTIRNSGQQAAGTFDVNIVWSADETPGGANEIVVGVVQVDGLAAGATTTQTLTIALDKAVLYANAITQTPAGSAVGTVSSERSYVSLVVDAFDGVPEINEANNSGQGHLIDSDDVTYFPWTAVGKGTVTPQNALSAIRAVNTADALHDSDGNGVVTPLEALAVLQRIGVERNESVSDAMESQPSTTELLVPLYQFPQFANNNSELRGWWRQIAEGATADRPITVVINPQNGEADPNDSASDFAAYLAATRLLATNPHVRIIGYVHTKWGARPPVDVENNVDFYEEYMTLSGESLIDGIFVDEMSADESDKLWYESLATYIRSRNLRGHQIVGNPGVVPAQGMLSAQVADVFVTFENAGTEFGDAVPPTTSPGLTYAALIHSVNGVAGRDRGVAERNRLIVEAKQKGFHYLYLTDDVAPNRYNNQPGFWTGILEEFEQSFYDGVSGVTLTHEDHVAAQPSSNVTTISAVASNIDDPDSPWLMDLQNSQDTTPVDDTEVRETDHVFTTPVSWLDVVSPTAAV